MSSREYRIIEHTADTGFEVKGNSKEELFAAAAKAFFHMMWKIGSDGESVQDTIEVAGSDLEELMVNFLEEFLYRYDAKELICTKIQIISLSETLVRAKAWMQQFNRESDQELLGVKAVTYHQLYIGRKDERWTARIFLDI